MQTIIKTYLGDIVAFYYNKEADCIIPKDQGGFILTKKEFKDILDGVKKFYDKVNEDEINKYNKLREDQKGGNISSKLNNTVNIISKDEIKKYGLIYFLFGNGYTKIGKTVNLKNRKNFFDIKLPFKCEIIHVIKSNHYSKCELFFHSIFSEKRSNGEWFDLNEDDINWIKSIEVKNF